MALKFSSQKEFVLTMAGAAIGLGNIWRFPYLVSNYGGGIFIALYLIALIGFGYFLLLSELSLGKTSGDDLFDAPSKIATQEMAMFPKFWGRTIGFLSLSAAFLMNIIYTIVIGWILFFFVQNFLYLGNVSSTAVTSKTFSLLTSKYEIQVFWSFISLIIVAFFICNKSIKWLVKLSTFFIPALVFILIYLTMWSLTQSGATHGALQLLSLNWSDVGISFSGIDVKRIFETLCAVIAQVIYSLSIGMGVAYIYGAYVSKNVNIVSSAKYVIFLDTICSILASLFVLSISSAYDIPKDVGVNLTFVSLPIAFEQMFAGSFLMFLFYGIFFLAALTTFISLYEPLVTYLSKKLDTSRGIAFTTVAMLNFSLVMIVLLSCTETSTIRVYGTSLFEVVSSTTDIVLLLSVLAISSFIGWASFGSVYQSLKKQFNIGMNPFETRYMQTVLKIIAPVLLLVLIASLLFQI
ncbi:MAG: sodium-dependent transporter [Alphaproteobacteria bacterium]|nr:sodium-dependent transporter [Alphaproteobacteria bacterium]